MACEGSGLLHLSLDLTASFLYIVVGQTYKWYRKGI